MGLPIYEKRNRNIANLHAQGGIGSSAGGGTTVAATTANSTT